MPDYGATNCSSEAEILRRASELVAIGEFRGAVTLLEQATVVHPRSEKIRQILSDISIRFGELLKSRQPLEYLSNNADPTDAICRAPSDEDFAFLEDHCRKLSEDEYHFDNLMAPQRPLSRSTLRLKISVQEQAKAREESNKVKIRYKKRDSVSQALLKKSHEQCEVDDTQHTSETQSFNSNEHKAIDDSSSDHEAALDENRPSEEVSVRSTEPNEELQSSYLSSTSSTNHQPHWDTIRPPQVIDDMFMSEPEWDDDEFEFVSEYVDKQDTECDEIDISKAARFDSNGTDENFSFDDSEAAFHDFWDDESEDLLEDDTEFAAVLENQLSRSERAQIVAVDFILEFNWNIKKLPFLIEVFSRPGWSSIKRALEREVQSGATVEELELAFEVKNLWLDSSRYWITFSKVWANGESTDAAYRNFSWKQALYLVRIFEQLPTLDEIHNFLEFEFDQWYHNRTFRLCFPAFINYLFLYRLNSRNEISSESGFGLPEEHDALDTQSFSYSHDNPMMKLNSLGIDLVYKYTTKSYYASDMFTDE